MKDQIYLDFKEENYGTEFTISLNKDALRKLERDCELYGKGEKIGPFILNIITKYHKQYYENNENTFNKLKKLINDEGIILTYEDEQKLDKISYRLTTQKNKELEFSGLYKSQENRDDYKRVTKNLRSTKINHKELRNILTNDKPENIRSSEYFENILMSYLSLPSYRRERIYYSDVVKQIKDAIIKKRNIVFKNVSTDKEFEAIPYDIVPSPEEIYNYFLYEYKGKANSIHLHNVDVLGVKEKEKLQPDSKEGFTLLRRNGVQNNINYKKETNSYGELFRVMLTSAGYKLFKALYLERPPVYKEEGYSIITESIEDDTITTLYFRCSKFQFFKYFRPFNKEHFAQKYEKYKHIPSVAMLNLEEEFVPFENYDFNTNEHLTTFSEACYYTTVVAKDQGISQLNRVSLLSPVMLYQDEKDSHKYHLICSCSQFNQMFILLKDYFDIGSISNASIKKSYLSYLQLYNNLN